MPRTDTKQSKLILTQEKSGPLLLFHDSGNAVGIREVKELNGEGHSPEEENKVRNWQGLQIQGMWQSKDPLQERERETARNLQVREKQEKIQKAGRRS